MMALIGQMSFLPVPETGRSSPSPPASQIRHPNPLDLMSHTQPTPTSPNFQLIFDNALKAYTKRTNNDLLEHPLADRLESCVG